MTTRWDTMPPRERELRTMPYAEYLRTPEWAERRHAALERAGWRCQVCNTDLNLQVHHRTYARRGAELPGDLTVLCAGHHALFHGKIPGPAQQRPKRSRRSSPKRARLPKLGPSEIADHAWSEFTCPRCGSEPRSACIAEREPWQEVCAERYRDAATALIDGLKSPAGGWTRKSLARLGVPWPPPRGWRQRLIDGEPVVPQGASTRIEPGTPPGDR